MKKTQITYYCDVCRAEIEIERTRNDWRGRNFGLCEQCRHKGWYLESWPRISGSGLIVKLANADKPEAVN